MSGLASGLKRKITQIQRWNIDGADTIVDFDAMSKVVEMPLRNDLTGSLELSLSPVKMREMRRLLFDGADLHSGDGELQVVVYEYGDLMMACRYFTGPDDLVTL